MNGRFALLSISLLVLALAGAAVFYDMAPKTDISFLMPEGKTPTMRALSQGLRSGPAARIILVGLEDGTAAERARISHELVRQLRHDSRFLLVANGQAQATKAQIEALLRHRFHLAPALSAGDFSLGALRRALEDSLAILSSGAGLYLKDYLPADPIGRLALIARNLQPQSPGRGPSGPKLSNGVWVSPDGARALLSLQTTAPGFDIDGQRAALTALREAFDQAKGESAVRLIVSGPGVIAETMQRRIKSEMELLSILASLAVAGIMLVAFRAPLMVLLAALPLAAGIVAGAGAVRLFFPEIHGATLTFGAALIGIAVDYPFHLAAPFQISKNGLGSAAARMRNLQRIWPTLRLSAITTIIAFTPILFSSFPGVAQLGLLAAVGLTVAALVSRYLLPRLLPPLRDPTATALWPNLTRIALRAGRLRWPALAAGLAAFVYLAFGASNILQNDLAALSPVDPRHRALDKELREQLGAADVRRLIVMSAPDEETLLRNQERLLPILRQLRKKGELIGFDLAAHYLPSKAAQAASLAALPPASVIKTNLQAAMMGLPFRAGTFDAFLRDLATARSSPPVGLMQIKDTPAGWRAAALLFSEQTNAGNAGTIGLVTLRGVRDGEQVHQAIRKAKMPSARYIDLKNEADNAMTAYRREAVIWIGLGLAAAVMVLIGALRNLADLSRVVLPIAVTLAETAAILHLTGSLLSIFHLLAILLVAGLGIDYAIFCNRKLRPGPEGAITLRALILCAATTITVFGLLAFSSLPVLHGIGLTAALGAALALVNAFILAPEELAKVTESTLRPKD